MYEKLQKNVPELTIYIYSKTSIEMYYWISGDKLYVKKIDYWRQCQKVEAEKITRKGGKRNWKFWEKEISQKKE